MAEVPEQPPAVVAPDPLSYAHFRAQRVVLSPGQVTLEGGVRVETWRAHLRADRLTLRRAGEDAIEADGAMSLRPCPCAGAPLTIEATWARLALDSGSVGVLTVRGATVRLGGIPVLPLPWMQLRSEHHWGLLPPRIAFRGRDGLLAGAGVHAPLGARAGLSMEPALYLRGGHELLSTLRVDERDAVRLRWDRRDQDLLAVTGQGRIPAHEGAVLWSVDASRGPRARSALIDLEASARLFDHGKVAWVVPWAGTFGAGFRGLAPRGEAPWTVGPQVSWAGSRRDGDASWWLDGMTMGREGGAASSLARSEIRLRRSWWWGMLRGQPELLALGAAGVGEGGGRDAWIDGIARGSLRLDVPLIRPENGGFWRMEPGVMGSLMGRQNSGTGAGIPGAQAVKNGTVGLSTFIQNFWTYGSHRAEASPELGVFWRRGEPVPVARAVLGTAGAWWRIQADSATRGRRGSMAGVGLEGGRSGGWRGSARVEGQAGDSPVEARWLNGDAPWVSGWFARAGWSGEVGAEAPLGRGLRLGGYGWADMTEKVWLGQRIDFLYNHPCGCLRFGVHGATRRGREGLDLWGTLSLG